MGLFQVLHTRSYSDSLTLVSVQYDMQVKCTILSRNQVNTVESQSLCSFIIILLFVNEILKQGTVPICKINNLFNLVHAFHGLDDWQSKMALLNPQMRQV
jgi:hypothetical protein